jgi:hypothetical protein
MPGSGILSKSKPAKPHLTQVGSGLAAEVTDLRKDVMRAVAPLAALTVEEFTDVVAASTTAIKTAAATVAAPTTYSGAALNGSVGVGLMNPPRQIVITTAGVTPADAPANATIVGIDVAGKALSETVTVAQTAAAATSTKCFAKVTSITLPAADGVGATLAFGTGTALGLALPAKSRAGLVPLIAEVVAGTKVTTGTMAAPAAAGPYGAYTPATAPNGTNDYAIFYEYDATAV